MSRHHPQPAAEIPVSRDIHLKLIGASIHAGFEKEDWEIAAEQLTNGCGGTTRMLSRCRLQKGTNGRACFYLTARCCARYSVEKNHHCLVEDDRIVYMGHAVSPSGFVNAVGAMPGAVPGYCFPIQTSGSWPIPCAPAPARRARANRRASSSKPRRCKLPLPPLLTLRPRRAPALAPARPRALTPVLAPFLPMVSSTRQAAPGSAAGRPSKTPRAKAVPTERGRSGRRTWAQRSRHFSAGVAWTAAPAAMSECHLF